MTDICKVRIDIDRDFSVIAGEFKSEDIWDTSDLAGFHIRAQSSTNENASKFYAIELTFNHTVYSAESARNIAAVMAKVDKALDRFQEDNLINPREDIYTFFAVVLKVLKVDLLTLSDGYNIREGLSAREFIATLRAEVDRLQAKVLE